jgi:hypothetical protein
MVENSSPDEHNKYRRNKYELSLINRLEVGEHGMRHEPLEPQAKLIKSKSKSKNILRLNTKSGEIGFKTENKRKRKTKPSKPSKAITSGMPSPSLTHHILDMIKSESNTTKTIGKQVGKVNIEESKDDVKTRPLTCNCKKSRCLKFY